jgi:hypothetical protein
MLRGLCGADFGCAMSPWHCPTTTRLPFRIVVCSSKGNRPQSTGQRTQTTPCDSMGTTIPMYLGHMQTYTEENTEPLKCSRGLNTWGQTELVQRK